MKPAQRALLTTHKQNIIRPDPSLSTGGALIADPDIARLRDSAGRQYRLNGATTRIGRLADNDIVLDDDTEVSRHHAVIIDTGTGFLITDLRSTNGVEVNGRLINPSVTLSDGARIRIGGHEFAFEIRPA